MADADLDSGCLLNKKIRNAQLAQYNFILGEIFILFYILFVMWVIQCVFKTCVQPHLIFF